MVTAPALEMLDLAKRLAVESTAIALSRLGQTTSRRKADNTVVTDVDHAIQDHIWQGIAEAYPDHAICAEEEDRGAQDRPARTEAQYCWIVDPLDGTRNFAASFPCFSTSIAVLERGRPIVGVVRGHDLNLLFAATLGGGTTLNGSPVRTLGGSVEKDMLIGIPSSKDQLTTRVLCQWISVPGLICRNLGSTALHLGLVASGALSAAFCRKCKIWDLAAGALMVTESGGRMTDLGGSDRSIFDLTQPADADLPFLAASPDVHASLLASIGDVTP